MNRSGLGFILWRDLPLLNFALYAVGSAHGAVANLEPARPDLVSIVVFPMVVVWGLYALRWRTASALERVVSLVVSVGAPAMVIAVAMSGHRYPIDDNALRDLYEVSAIGNTAVIVAHAGWRWGRAGLAFFVGPAALYGILLENGGIMLGYFSEMNYRWYLGGLPAPLATLSGWVMVYYLVLWVAWEVRAHVPWLQRWPVLSAAIATASALLLDLAIDPIATEVGFWAWHSALRGQIFGVPALNFVAWGAAVFPFAWWVSRREAAFGLAAGEITVAPHRGWMWTRVPIVLALASVLFLGTMGVVEGGFDGPTYRILHQAAIRYGVVSHGAEIWQPGAGTHR